MASGEGCRVRTGRSPIVLVAPHGGRRRPGRRRARLRINDLHTAALTEELAARLDASAVVNAEIDRNDVDLNRLPEVREQAPWFAAALEKAIGGVLDRHATARVLFVHGWNATLTKCDLGIGRRVPDGKELPEDGLTVSSGFATGTLVRLRAHCAARGIDTAIGERFPASHPDNVLQAFRREGSDRSLGERIAAWVAAGRIEAVQIELGIPLRWPGPWRQHFIEALVDALADREAGDASSSRPEGDPLPPPSFLQLHDPVAGIGVSAGIAPGRRRLGRLLVLPGGSTSILFVGEDGSPGHAVGSLRFEPDRAGVRLRFDGPAARVDDGRLYVRTEDALAASSLVRVAVDLACRPIGPGPYGEVSGSVTVEGARHDVRAWAFTDPKLGRAPLEPAAPRSLLSVAFGRDLALAISSGPEGGRLQRLTPETVEEVCAGTVEVRLADDGYTPEELRVDLDGAGLLSATALGAMSVIRDAGDGGRTRVTFGVATFRLGSVRTGSGFYEYARRVSRHARDMA